VAGSLCALFLALPSPAVAAESIGQAGGGATCALGFPYVQRQGSVSYSPTAAGVITSWSTEGGVAPNQRVSLYVLRPVPGSPDAFTAVASDGPVTLRTPNAVNTLMGRHIPIAAGDRISLFAQSSPNCAASTGSSSDVIGLPGDSGNPPFGQPIAYDDTVSNFLVNIAAVVEPDADADLAGDETQDNCLGAPGPSLYGCPAGFKVGKPRRRGKRRVLISALVPGAGQVEAVPVKPDGRDYSQKPPFFGRTTFTRKRTRHRVVLNLSLRDYMFARAERKGRVRIRVRVAYDPFNSPKEKIVSFILRG
jgi:hypothetical protein